MLDQADAPQPGDVFPYINVNYVPIADGGPDAVWDLSGIGSAGPVNLPCVDPAATSYADQFPTAGIAFDAGSLISYMRADATGLYAVGAWKNVGTESILIHFTDESLFLPYPCTYGTSFSDPFAYTYDYSGGTVDGSGSANYEADGFGTLVMPYDTIHNVLRVAGVDTSMEGIPGLSYLTVSQQVYFFKPGIHYYLLSATQVSQSVNGGPAQQVSSLFFLAPSALSGVHELAMQDIGIEAWPNPASDRLQVALGIAGGHEVHLDLYDGLGRCVRANNLTTTVSGIQQVVMDVQGLADGIYLLKATDDHGQEGSCRVVVR